LWATPRRILAYREPIDVRKSCDGLIGVVCSRGAEDLLSATLFVFVNRPASYPKRVAWERTGFVLCAKRLEQGRFVLPGDATKQLLHEQMLPLIPDGIALEERRVVCSKAPMSHEARAGAVTRQQIVALLVDHDDLKPQLAWLKQQVFGSKPERRVADPDAHQLTLGA
jgi:transposase